MYNAVGSSPLVSGFFWDDHWSATGSFPDSSAGRIVEDTGMTPADLVSITADYYANMAYLTNVTLAKGKFAWQLFWTGGAPDSVGSTGPKPIVHNQTCAADLRALCNATSPAQTRTMMYGLGGTPETLSQFGYDLAAFLLIRGPYAYLVRLTARATHPRLQPLTIPHNPTARPTTLHQQGHGWQGCSHFYDYPSQLSLDYGEPLGLCAETAPGSGVFSREWSKSTVTMDCNTNTPTITMK
jgi:hypothetical protein